MGVFQGNQVPGFRAQILQPQLQPLTQSYGFGMAAGRQGHWRKGGGKRRGQVQHTPHCEIWGRLIGVLPRLCKAPSRLLWTWLQPPLAGTGVIRIVLSPLGAGLDTPQFSASLAPRDCPVRVLSYNEQLLTQNKAWALCSWDAIHIWPRLTQNSEEVGIEGLESRRRERQMCRATQ